MKAQTVLPCSFRCGLSQCPSFARAVPLVAEANRRAAARGTKTPAPPTGLTTYHQNETH